MFPSLMRGWCRNRVHFETAGIQRPAKASNNATLSGRIPSLKYDNGSLSRAEIGLLDCLKSCLHRTEPTLVVRKLDLSMLGY